MPVSDIRIIGRATQGVRIMRIKGDDRVVTVSKVLKAEDEEEILEAAETEHQEHHQHKPVSDADFVGIEEEQESE